MHQILIKMDEIEDPKESGKLDMQFHNKLIEASHNRMIVLYTSMIAELINQFIADFRVRIMANQRQADALRRAHWNILRFLSGQRLCSRKLRNAAAF